MFKRKEIIRNVEMNRKLVTLTEQHPELPTHIIIRTEGIYDDEYANMVGSIYDVEIAHVCEASERFLIKEWDDDETILNAVSPGWEYLSEEEQDKILDDIDWKEAIVIWVGI